MNKKYKTVGIVIVVAVLGLGLFRGGDDEERQSIIMTEAQEGVLKVSVVGYGEVQALENHKLVPQIENQATLNFVVENGENSTHILNAISPAFTSSFAFAEHVVTNYIEKREN